MDGYTSDSHSAFSPMTTAFFAPPENLHGNVVVLPDEEAEHAVRVLRHRTGDEVEVVDGAGCSYRVRLESVDRHQVSGIVLERHLDAGEPSFRLVIAIAPLKNPNRFETFVEKAVELGVSRIIPIQTARTERGGLRENRLRRIALAAMKQCGRSRLLEIDPPTPWEAVRDDQSADLRLVCHPVEDSRCGIAAVLRERAPDRIVAAVGPEGGFTEEEVRGAEGSGWRRVGLGQRRLRAETAGLAVAAAVVLHFEASPPTAP